MQVDEAVISYVVRNEALADVQGAGITADDFIDEYATVWKYLCRTKRQHDAVPSEDVLVARFPDLELPTVREGDIGLLLHQLRQRRKYREFIAALYQAGAETNDFEQVDSAVQQLQAKLNALSSRDGSSSHLVDLFTPDAAKDLLKELRVRRSGRTAGIPTGLERFDSLIGGLGAQKMVTVCGRPGLGKSWLDLLFVVSAVMSGKKVVLYPLEMTLYETAARLYTIMSQRMFGMDKVLKNTQLNAGRISPHQLKAFMKVVNRSFKGQLLIADVARLNDPYTLERIESEVELHRPDMFWIDYITLLKTPQGSERVDDWQQLRILSGGVKNIAMRNNCVGGISAQVNREAIKGRHFLPRLEHIAYGDAIGQDTDIAISLNRNHQGLWYSVVKNRGGIEIPMMCCTFNVDVGKLEELDPQPEYEPQRRRAANSSDE